MQTTTNSPTSLSGEQLLSLYRQMTMIRRTEEALVRLYQQGHIPGACHTYIGQEAVAVGVCAHLRRNDVVFSTHRGHGHALAKGVPPQEVIAELLGRETGCSRGRGGSMHLFSPEVGLMGTTGIVGPNILQATGAGLSFQLLKSDQVSVCFFGDGAISNGAFHEGINLAAIWDLPIVFVCENNQYATEVPFGYATRNTDVADRARCYGIDSKAVDGNDVLAVHTAADEAVSRCRSGRGPFLIECRTYRTRPHAEGMRDVGYRTREEVKEWEEKDPLLAFRAQLVEQEQIALDAVKAAEDEIAALVEDAVRFAEGSPYPDTSTASDDIFSS